MCVHVRSYVLYPRQRYVPTKRAEVASGLVMRFTSLLWLSHVWSRIKGLVMRLFCCLSKPHTEASGANSEETSGESVGFPSFFLGHTRFATSSGKVYTACLLQEYGDGSKASRVFGSCRPIHIHVHLSMKACPIILSRLCL